MIEGLPAKGSLPSRRVRRKRIREAALRGAHGRFWYELAEKEIWTVAKAWGVDPVYVAVAVAATSPATPIIMSLRMAKGGGSGSNIGKARAVVKRQAWTGRGSDALHPATPGLTILREFERCIEAGGGVLDCLAIAFSKPDRVKTHSFVRNLIGFGEPVTVDTLVAREVVGRNIRVTEARHAEIAQDIKAVAKELGWQPREVMAAVWTAAGGSGDLRLATAAERVKTGRHVERMAVSDDDEWPEHVERMATPLKSALQISQELFDEWWMLEVDTWDGEPGPRAAFVAAMCPAVRMNRGRDIGKLQLMLLPAAVAYLHEPYGPVHQYDDVFEEQVERETDPDDRARYARVLAEVRKLQAKFPKCRRKA